MTLFHSQMSRDFKTRVFGLFPAGTLSFIAVAAATRTQAFQDYAQAFLTSGCEKAVALINEQDPGIVPYLTVRANLLINTRENSLANLPPVFREDVSFLQRTADHLTPTESLYVQFFRGVLSQRPVILANGLPAGMTPTETRAFLSVATSTLAGTQTRLVVFTPDQSLLAAHPETSFTTVPPLTADSAHQAEA
ncbi:hypothetical protein ACFQ3L_09610 [Lacticaseibacillus jixianensis]|uniref:ABC transporter n=1 Tax=Lacticaseibacillus jixianensis TaxID=2486012 RepID=A0ABW4BC21_9LACO|nr:hypothetical protein [Lacticaseibacillus jixianensis]